MQEAIGIEYDHTGFPEDTGVLLSTRLYASFKWKMIDALIGSSVKPTTRDSVSGYLICSQVLQCFPYLLPVKTICTNFVKRLLVAELYLGTYKMFMTDRQSFMHCWGSLVHGSVSVFMMPILQLDLPVRGEKPLREWLALSDPLLSSLRPITAVNSYCIGPWKEEMPITVILLKCSHSGPGLCTTSSSLLSGNLSNLIKDTPPCE
ncbi:hypothetical protein EDD36DRAFT_272724 [Exophiala viscosa]|uniref:Uncharacterized protein n=1 Tax=Exophiala viscosa TaxID=2486360 RepID=A0AAN6IBR8_9EURO|nr:hypothetical protein EDD36DRAFT_272724 [Exophiala viscosa]